MTIKVIIISTKVAYITEILVIALILYNLIIQQIDKNATLIPDATVYHTTSTSTILSQDKTSI